ncbi:hypothetical protein CLHOM_29950 [Clostridium homopropionicum DSM 5847]|uniref:NADPH-dependent FMN reductase n=1 Tax=Clostridium homopropionicum DSM 5847 TaxID=1121318 RepID=A0A0L6Z6X6_9CLOT|nr:hypothetical protein [Clostridium homopropionicum]KOA18711.1 hypothetical protein CLHOM_29950 [Clostridium homopropionicum DSM 5847]SFG53489.1 hypothetical protein SAMN04488501_110132 [Clostridium homopropionicum]
MSKFVAIIGSPKLKKSSSSAIVHRISEILHTDIAQYRALDIINAPNKNVIENDILQADILLFVFPLYVDSLPGSLMEALVGLEKTLQNSTNSLPKVYAICNCGFYDAEQTAVALDIIQNYCNKTGLDWQYGIGIGCGGMIAEEPSNLKANGPLRNIFKALSELCADMLQGYNDKKENIFVRASIPRFLYHFGGNMGWNINAKKNNAKKMLRARPHEII